MSPNNGTLPRSYPVAQCTRWTMWSCYVLDSAITGLNTPMYYFKSADCTNSNTEEGENNKRSGEGVTVCGWGRGGQLKAEWSTAWCSEARVVRCRCREHKVSVVKHHWAWRWVIILSLWILLLRIRRDVLEDKVFAWASSRWGYGWWPTGAQAAEGTAPPRGSRRGVTAECCKG